MTKRKQNKEELKRLLQIEEEKEVKMLEKEFMKEFQKAIKKHDKVVEWSKSRHMDYVLEKAINYGIPIYYKSSWNRKEFFLPSQTFEKWQYLYDVVLELVNTDVSEECRELLLELSDSDLALMFHPDAPKDSWFSSDTIDIGYTLLKV